MDEAQKVKKMLADSRVAKQEIIHLYTPSTQQLYNV